MAAAGNGYAGTEDNGELAAHDREGLVIQLFSANLHIEKALLLLIDLFDLEDDIAGFFYAGNCIQLVEALNHAGDPLAALGDGTVLKGCQFLSPSFR